MAGPWSEVKEEQDSQDLKLANFQSAASSYAPGGDLGQKSYSAGLAGPPPPCSSQGESWFKL